VGVGHALNTTNEQLQFHEYKTMTTSDKPSHTDADHKVECNDGEGDNARDLSDGWGMAIFFAVTFVILAALIFWPVTKQFMPGLADPPSIQPLGPVLQARFVGGFGTRTEIRTSAKTLLLRGAVEIDVGTSVERRTTFYNDEMCVTGTSRCHDIASR